MINHGRTLLLNIQGTDYSAIGEEYIPAAFVPRTLTPNLSVVYRAFFGTNPDRSMLNFRSQQLLTLIHSSDLAHYLTDLDPRLTYWPFDNSIYQYLIANPHITTLSGTDPISVIGDCSTLQDAEALLHSWTITIINGSTVSLQDNSTTSGVNENYTITGGLSDLHYLPNSSLQVRFAATPADQWLIKVLYQPTVTITDLWNSLQSNNLDNIEQLFNSIEPYVDFRMIWRNQRFDISLRLSAAVLAFIYRMNEQPTGG